MEELNSAGPVTVRQCRAHSFYLDYDSTNAKSPYVRGGIVTQVHQ
jgi:hypothetical protein